MMQIIRIGSLTITISDDGSVTLTNTATFNWSFDDAGYGWTATRGHAVDSWHNSSASVTNGNVSAGYNGWSNVSVANTTTNAAHAYYAGGSSWSADAQQAVGLQTGDGSYSSGTDWSDSSGSNSSLWVNHDTSTSGQYGHDGASWTSQVNDSTTLSAGTYRYDWNNGVGRGHNTNWSLNSNAYTFNSGNQSATGVSGSSLDQHSLTINTMTSDTLSLGGTTTVSSTSGSAGVTNGNNFYYSLSPTEVYYGGGSFSQTNLSAMKAYTLYGADGSVSTQMHTDSAAHTLSTNWWQQSGSGGIAVGGGSSDLWTLSSGDTFSFSDAMGTTSISFTTTLNLDKGTYYSWSASGFQPGSYNSAWMDESVHIQSWKPNGMMTTDQYDDTTIQITPDALRSFGPSFIADLAGVTKGLPTSGAVIGAEQATLSTMFGSGLAPADLNQVSGTALGAVNDLWSAPQTVAGAAGNSFLHDANTIVATLVGHSQLFAA